MKRRPALLLFPLFLALPGAAHAVEGVFHFTFFEMIPGITAKNRHVLIMALVALILILMALVLRRSFQDETRLAPSGRFGLRSFVEMVMETVLALMKEIIGHDYKRFVPLIGTSAFFILFANVLGIVPGLGTSNDNTNTTAALAITVFIAYNIAGVKAHGALGWAKHFMGPLEGKLKYILAPLMIPIELISHLARPLSLCLRLFGNMMGDHTVLGVFVGLVAVPLLFPLPIMVLGLLVCIVQTLVFCLLSMVYISQAIAHEEH